MENDGPYGFNLCSISPSPSLAWTWCPVSLEAGAFLHLEIAFACPTSSGLTSDLPQITEEMDAQLASARPAVPGLPALLLPSRTAPTSLCACATQAFSLLAPIKLTSQGFPPVQGTAIDPFP